MLSQVANTGKLMCKVRTSLIVFLPMEWCDGINKGDDTLNPCLMVEDAHSRHCNSMIKMILQKIQCLEKIECHIAAASR